MSKQLYCPYFNASRCLSCSLLDVQGVGIQAAKLREQKNALVNTALSSHDGSAVEIKDLWAPPMLFESRAKARFSVTGTSVAPTIGLLDDEFNGIELENCPLHLPLINRVIAGLPKVIREFKLQPYEIRTGRGELKNIIVVCNSRQTQAMLRFVLRSTEAVPRISKAIPLLQKNVKELQVISANIQPVPHQVPEGAQEITLTEQTRIWETYNGLRFAVAPKAFLQVTPQTAEALYLTLGHWIKELNIPTVLDLYCGIGGFALHAAREGATVDGYEIVAESVTCARLSAEANKLNTVNFHTGAVEDSLSEIAARNYEAIICNPPRRGLGALGISQVLRLAPKYLFYSSCSIETFLSDGINLEENYQLKKIQTFDMFPLTKHFEVLGLFIKVD